MELQSRRLGHLLVLALIVLMMTFPPIFSLAVDKVKPPLTGQYVESIEFRIMNDSQDEIAALLDKQVDLIGHSLDPEYLQTLRQADSIEVANTSRNGYDFFLFNNARYPLNMTTMRQAIAYAFDKEKAATEVWLGHASPLDCPVPLTSPFCAEDSLLGHYYSSAIDRANTLLDDAGFDINETTGFRLRPDGEPFVLQVEVSDSSRMNVETGSLMEEALSALRINSTVGAIDPYDLRCDCVWYDSDFDIRLLENRFYDYQLDWLAHGFWWDGTALPDVGYGGFTDPEFDTLRQQILVEEDHSDLLQYATQIQEIIVEKCPVLVVCQPEYLSAYRTDRFEEFVWGPHQGASSWWTNYCARLRESAGGPFGGALIRSHPIDICSFNILTIMFPESRDVLQMQYDGLFRASPEGDDVMWLLTDYTIETHDDNAAVPLNHTRLTFNIVQNATWTDGEPLTAYDIAFSLNYLRNAVGNPWGLGLSGMTAAYAQTTYALLVEFNTESYRNLHRIAYTPVLPKHIFQQILPEEWNQWSPFPPIEEMVTSGPFNVSEYVAGDSIRLTCNDNYFRYSPATTRTVTTTITTTTGTTDSGALISPFLVMGWTMGVGIAATVTLVAVWLRKRS